MTASCEWLPIESAPKDGSEVLVYRPLAHKTFDPHVTIKKSTPHDNGCWPATVPDGADGTNFTSGSCYASHWMPLPSPPQSKSAGADTGATVHSGATHSDGGAL